MADRKAEIERRKKRLEELRLARDSKKKEVKDKEALNKDLVSTSGSLSGVSSERETVDELVAEILGPSVKAPAAAAPTGSGKSDVSGPGKDADVKRVDAPVTAVKQSNKRSVHLSIDQLLPINIKPKTIEVYEKHTQTVLDESNALSPTNNESFDIDTSVSVTPIKDLDKGKEERGAEAMEETGSLPLPQGKINDESRQLILQSEEFAAFIERSSLVMERLLAETSDVLFDISAGNEAKGTGDGLSINVSKKRQFFDERWTKGKIVSSIAWSPHHSGMVLASYYQVDSNVSSDPDGTVLMWDLKFKKDTPDFIFNCYSPVMSVTFSKFHPHYVIGGTYSGQIVLWDIRSGKRTPVQRSLLSSSAHTHPIYCLELIGSEHAHSLISVSTDGKLCSWNIDNLSQPQESIDLQSRHPRPVAVTSLDFPVGEVNKFIVGSEEGVVYQGQRHGKKPGVVVQYEGHYGNISSVSCHKATNIDQADFSHLFLSSSVDWTVKLWSLKLSNEQQVTSKTATPLCSFETNSDYVNDVKWSPIHPALFVSVNVEGKIDFWNLNHDVEVPILTEGLDIALSKVSWSPNGLLLAVGDVDGNIHIYEAGEALCVPQSDDWTNLQQTLYELQQTSSDENNI